MDTSICCIFYLISWYCNYIFHVLW